MALKVWTQKTSRTRNKIGIINDQVSETLPNQTMSMKELVDRFVKGYTIPGLKNFPFDSDQPGEMSLPDIGMLSKTEAAQFLIDVGETIKENEQELIETRKQMAFHKAQRKAAKAATIQKRWKHHQRYQRECIILICNSLLFC